MPNSWLSRYLRGLTYSVRKISGGLLRETPRGTIAVSSAAKSSVPGVRAGVGTGLRIDRGFHLHIHPVHCRRWIIFCPAHFLSSPLSSPVFNNIWPNKSERSRPLWMGPDCGNFFRPTLPGRLQSEISVLMNSCISHGLRRRFDFSSWLPLSPKAPLPCDMAFGKQRNPTS